MKRSFAWEAILASALLAVALPAHADLVYVGDASGNFMQYNTATGVTTWLGNNATVLYGLAFTAGGTLYGNDNGNGPNINYDTVNTTNGALTHVANIGHTGGADGIITSAPGGSNTFYFTDLTNDLYSMTPSTGATVEVGSGLGVSIGLTWDLNYGPDGNLYLSNSGSLYKVNTMTGLASLVGSFGSSLSMQSIVEGDGNLYGFNGKSMYTIDLSSGTATFLRNTPTLVSGHTVGNFDSETTVYTPTSPVPEPHSLFLLVSALPFVVELLRRKRARAGA